MSLCVRIARMCNIASYFSDIDNNGYLDKNDFECLAVRTSVIESKGEVKPEKYEQNRKVMRNLWNEIADLADFNKVSHDRRPRSANYILPLVVL